VNQRITIEQLNELSDDQKKRLRGWWEPEQYDVVRDLNHNATFDVYYKDGNLSDSYIDYDKNDCLPLMNIGQCIKLLKDYGWDLEIKDARIGIGFRVANDTRNGMGITRDELIDALWEAVKKVL
jgi:hypothetical protein